MTDCTHKKLRCKKCMRDGDLEFFKQEEHRFAKRHAEIIRKLVEENDELRAQVESAYEEGWRDGYTTTSVSGYEVDWVMSETKAAIQGDGREDYIMQPRS